MADLEKLHVKLGLSGTYWDKRPSFCIRFNDQVIKQETITSDSDVVEYFEFDVECDTEFGELSISLLNKSDSDTVENEDKTGILKDMLLNIDSLEVDDISLGMIPFNHSEYYPAGKDTVIKNCVNLGWNGTWKLKWQSPFYIWLLETM
jgi:hypothetical protein